MLRLFPEHLGNGTFRSVLSVLTASLLKDRRDRAVFLRKQMNFNFAKYPCKGSAKNPLKLALL